MCGWGRRKDSIRAVRQLNFSYLDIKDIKAVVCDHFLYQRINWQSIYCELSTVLGFWED